MSEDKHEEEYDFGGIESHSIDFEDHETIVDSYLFAFAYYY